MSNFLCVFPRASLIFMALVAIILVVPDKVRADICASVKIELLQEAAFERNAFMARMRINNDTDLPLDNLRIDLSIKDVYANDARTNFFVKTETIENIDAIDGSDSIMADDAVEIHWLLIPLSGTGGDTSEGELYYIGANISYVLGNRYEVSEVVPDSILVLPQPLLAIDYFLPEQVYGDDPFTAVVEEPVPFSLGVRMTNNGAGPAANMQIVTGSPKIVDNEQGLLIDFDIIGSEVNGEAGMENFLVKLGTIAPAECSVARWLMTCSLSGKFLEFAADFTHSEEFGGEATSLVESANTHLVIHDVLVDLPGRDMIRDFLATYDDSPSSALMVYESECGDMAVSNRSSQASFEQNGSTWILAIPSDPGAFYVKLTDPYNGELAIDSMVRSDGKKINQANAWLSKEYELESHKWNYFINLFDVAGTGVYTLSFGGYIDTDHDGLNDEEENARGTNPFNPDSDGDGLSDGFECQNGLNPLLWDSDGDGFSDGYESDCGTDPDDINDVPVIYVDISNNSGIEDGTVEHPFSTIEDGISHAQEYWTVKVAAGNYLESITISSNIRLAGDNPSTTFIDAAGNSTGVLFEGSGVGSSTVFSGFTVTNAMASGITCANGASPIIKNTIMLNNGAEGTGVISVDGNSDPWILNNTISFNADAEGMQILSSDARIINNIITDNRIGLACPDAMAMPFIDYNNIWNNVVANYFGCQAGLNDLSEDPRFVDSASRDFHLSVYSGCIDQGVPVGRLAHNYEGGTIINLKNEICLWPDDLISITNGMDIERGWVNDYSGIDITLNYPFTNEYSTEEQSYVFDILSDFHNEPPSHTQRINLGAYGNTEEAATAPDYCEGDFDNDRDVDGSDLATFLLNQDEQLSLKTFGRHFGRDICPVNPYTE